MSVCEIEPKRIGTRDKVPGYDRWRLHYVRELRSRKEARTNTVEVVMHFYGRVTPRAILTAVAEQFRITLPELTGHCQVWHLCNARFAAACLMRKGLGMSTPEIGRRLGDRDPTTIRNALMRADFLLMTDPKFSVAFEAVKSRLWPDGFPHEVVAEPPEGAAA
jgi:chromosomal replication initiation ATPase DnaA